METRGAKHNELQKIIDACMEVNGYKPRYAKHHLEDSTYKIHQSRVCIVDNKIVSYLRISERQMHIGRSIVKVGGIGHVWTLEKYRHKGYSTAVLRDTNKYMLAEGYDLGLLFTAIQPFYARLDWASFKHTSFKMDLSPLKRFEPNDWIVRSYQIKDLPQIIELYHIHNKTRTGTIVRIPNQWSDGYGLSTGLQPTVVVEKDGMIAAYANLGLGEDPELSNVNDSFLSGYYPNIREIAYNPKYKDALIALAHGILIRAQKAGLKTITGHLPRHDPMTLLLSQESGNPLSFTSSETSMFRIVSLYSLLSKLVPEFEGRLQKAQLTSTTASYVIQVENQSCTLQIHDNRINILEGSLGTTSVNLNTYLFIKLLFGDSTFAELTEYNSVLGLKLSDKDTSILNVLFPKGEYIHWICDYY